MYMNIILIGFMGSGKTSVAVKLAKKIKCNPYETDVLVLARSGRKSIKEIFSHDGEIRFREMEVEVAKELSKKNNAVISTGGGMVMNKLCIDYLKQNGTVIYLYATFEEIEKHLEGDTTRPLFTDIAAAKKLFHFRKKLYKQYADIAIITNGMSIEEIVNSIAKKI